MILRLSSLLFVVLLAACAPRPEPPPAPLPTMEAAMTEAQVRWYLPYVVITYTPPETKAGVGIATQAAEVVTPTSAARAGASWYYDWAHVPTLGGLPEQVGVEFVPMVWKSIPAQLTCPAGGAPLLWLNEPNEPGQAEMSPAQAVDLLEQLIATCPNARLIGPQMAPRDRYNGWPWAVAFYAEWQRRHRTAPPTDLALHIYDHPARFAETIDGYYRVLADWVAPDAPIWITEFNVPCGNKSPAEIAPLVAAAIAVLEGDARVERYAIFVYHNGGRWPGLECAELVDNNGQLTAVGAVYGGGQAYP